MKHKLSAGFLPVLVSLLILGGGWFGAQAEVLDSPASEAAPPVAQLELPPPHDHDPLAPASIDDVIGPQRVMVLRVYFQDYAATTRYTQAQVQGFFGQLDTLWQNISYGVMSIDSQVSTLFQLPDNRSAYIDDGGDVGTCAENSSGDLSCGDKFGKVLLDAIANSPGGLDWTNLQAVMVVMAETNASQFHRGQGAGSCNLPMGPGGAVANVGCAIFSENPSETDLQVWGRWAHEIGHAFQEGGPAHPSNYNSEFELMDSNYPGQSGVYEKQAGIAFPGWLPTAKYETFTPSCSVGPTPCTGLGGGSAFIWAEEYDPAGLPNVQAVRAYITDNLYYLISVRRRVNGDELNGQFQGGPPGTNGIPDEGVLIERVEEGADQVVTVMGKGGNRNDLWDAGDTYSNASDGIQILVETKIDDDNYQVYVIYDQDASMQPDVMIYPWTSPPGNTWETTDIWIDSPVNGYNTYLFGTWNDLSGNPVPRGNGDEPAVGLVNRLYARVRNIGGAPATNVMVNFEITDPPGLGISGANGWASLGTVGPAQFPDLANINPGEFVDVFIDWTPNFPPPEGVLDGESFAYHTCLRVTIDPVAGETVLGNQDGDKEQENVFYFKMPDSPGAPAYDAMIHLHNDDLVNPRFFVLDYVSELPADWTVEINGGQMGLELGPGEMVDIPVQITAGTLFTPLGTIYGVDISASYHRLLVSDLDPKDQHPTFEKVGGVRVETAVLQPTTLDCIVREADQGQIYVRCKLEGLDPYYDPDNPPTVLIQAIGRGGDGRRIFLPDLSLLLAINRQGDGEGYLRLPARQGVVEVVALFSGSQYLSSAASPYIAVNPYFVYLPLVLRNNVP